MIKDKGSTFQQMVLQQVDIPHMENNKLWPLTSHHTHKLIQKESQACVQKLEL